MFKKLKEKIISFHKDEEAALTSTEVIILIAVAGGVAALIGSFAYGQMNKMKDTVGSQLEGFNNFSSGGSGGTGGTSGGN